MFKQIAVTILIVFYIATILNKRSNEEDKDEDVVYWTNLDAESFDSNNLNVLIVFGTRPEMIKIAPIIWEYENNKNSKYENTSLFCVFTNQHYDLINDGILTTLHLSSFINFKLNNLNNNKNEAVVKIDRLSFLTTRILIGISSILNDFDNIFDVILVHGDTSSAMASALAVFYNNYNSIYLGHIEAGLRTFDHLSPFPEEINRQFIAKMANIHFAPSPINRMNLLNEDIKEENIIITGNTVIDTMKYIYKSKQYRNEFIKYNKKQQLFIHENDNDENIIYGLFTIHRRELIINKNTKDILNAIYTILEMHNNLHLFYPVHPSQKTVYSWINNVKKSSPGALAVIDRLHLIEPLSPIFMPFLYEKLSIIISDSGGIQEEITAFNNITNQHFIPILIIREKTGRVEIIESNQGILVGYNAKNIIYHSNKILNNIKNGNMKELNNYFPFGDGTASKVIMKHISKLKHIAIGSTTTDDDNNQDINPNNTKMHSNMCYLE